MDEHLILEFATRPDAEQALAIVNGIAAAWWQSQGFTVIDGQLIGKNAKTGLDEPEKAKTISWDDVQESPDGTFYFTSPSSSPKFVDWREYVPQGVVIPDDKPFPESWIQVDAL